MRIEPNRRRHLAAVTVAVLAVTGCGGGQPPSQDSGPIPDTTTETTTSPTESPQPTDEAVRATGTVVKGVEPNCLLLDTGETRYLLLAATAANSNRDDG